MGDKWAKREWDARKNRGEKQEESDRVMKRATGCSAFKTA